MIDKIVLMKMTLDPRWDGSSGYLKAREELPSKLVSVLDGIIIARANEMCYSYNDLFDYILTEKSERLAESAKNGVSKIDYALLP